MPTLRPLLPHLAATPAELCIRDQSCRWWPWSAIFIGLSARFRQVVLMSFDPKQPYNDLPLLPPAGELETRAVLKKCVVANRALAELKGAGDLIPNQAILINAIPLQEAKLSSEIENIVTTQDALFQAAIDEGRNTDFATKEVLRYRTALRHGSEALKGEPLRVELLKELCGILRRRKGNFPRRQQRLRWKSYLQDDHLYSSDRGQGSSRKVAQSRAVPAGSG